MSRVEVDQVAIAYQVTGEVRPALLVHGWPESSGDVAGSWRYERLDGPGHWMQLNAPEQVSALLLGLMRCKSGLC
jgi:hypothetical protein